jgi:DNA-binding transcriptional LysR family regulator
MIRTACSRGSNNAWHAIRRTVRLRGDRGAEELRQGRDPPRHRPLDAQPEPSALEERLGARLLNRTTRSVALTEAGARLLARVRPAFCELAAATAEAAGDPHKPTGLLRLAVQPPVANLMIAPMLARFMHAHPGIQLDIAVIRMPGDIVREGFDAGIRFGEQVERDMIAMQVMGEARFLVVAAPDYLARHAPPKTPRDLRDHACIRNRLPNGAVFGWDFHKGRRVIHAAVEGRLVVNDIELSIRAVLDGLGLAYLLQDYIAADVAAGRLVPVLEDWTPRLSGFFLYHSSRRRVTPALAAFIAFVKAESRQKGLVPSAPPRASIRPNYRLVGARPR